jgi:hypothetical protein
MSIRVATVGFYVHGLLRTSVNSSRIASCEITLFDEELFRACAMGIYHQTNHDTVTSYRLIFFVSDLTRFSPALLCASAIYEDPQDTRGAPRRLTTSVWESQMK